jgi:hypothetical protein
MLNKYLSIHWADVVMPRYCSLLIPKLQAKKHSNNSLTNWVRWIPVRCSHGTTGALMGSLAWISEIRMASKREDNWTKSWKESNSLPRKTEFPAHLNQSLIQKEWANEMIHTFKSFTQTWNLKWKWLRKEKG